MSYDITFHGKLEGTDQFIPIEWLNFTSNAGDMIRAACNDIGVPDWNGKTGEEIQECVTSGVKAIQENPDQFRKYESDNKWGTVEQTVGFLEEVSRLCAQYPTAKIEVDY